jgi:hypothetical protein
MLTADAFVDVGTTSSNSKVEISSGAPKLQEYSDNIKSFITLFFKGSAYSFDNSELDGAQQTATGVMFTKSKDVETTKTKRLLFQDTMSSLIEKVLIVKGLMKSGDEREFTVEVSENHIVNETVNIENLIKRLDSGLITHTEILTKLDGLSPQEAEQKYEAIKKEQDAVMQNQLEVMAQKEGGEDDDAGTIKEPNFGNE